MRRPALLVAVALLCAVPAAQAAPRYTARRLAVFKDALYVAAPPARRDHRLFVVERRGRILVLSGRRVRRRPFLDISRDVLIQRPLGSDQRGMFSMAFAPDYSRSGRFYVSYVGRDDMLHLEEFRRSRDPNRAAPSTRRLVLSVGPASPFDHGGQLQFGPDRLLYMGAGEMADPTAAQDLGSLKGKILRLDPRASGGRPYSVPPDNPFVGTPGARPEVYLYGLRQPWRFSFDRLRGDLAIGEIGDNTAEEVDFLRRGTGAGSNLGYPWYEGNRQPMRGPPPTNYLPPVIEHLHSRGFCAVTGGYVVRDRGLRGLYGRYLYGDQCTPRLRSAVLRPGRASGDRFERLRVPFLTSFGEDSRAHLYAVTYGGAVYRLTTARRR
jgi:glucose/arabinose dehydrogenase